ncbi:unnamed protein product [Rotaria magnacalcarata]|uniref:Uncharacterized protein n=3 Tax=Rotaria magnacalcarata TaxID=392030 RepID=A0A816SW48_9BILA|nr:unnamed protein product [Rotaria magnacalcarata]
MLSITQTYLTTMKDITLRFCSKMKRKLQTIETSTQMGIFLKFTNKNIRTSMMAFVFLNSDVFISKLKLIKPEWIEDGPKESLSSLHINPEGIRVAIASKYNAVDCIRIFRLASILDENYQKQSRLLCRIDTQCALCVRFSYTSDVLAVASRQSVLLYHVTATNSNVTNQPVQSSSSFGDVPETWRLRSSLPSGHVADILDAAWSPSNDHYLASCSIDNHTCIYAWPSATLVTTLRGHTGLVRELTWDPTGLLLTSQSSDGTVNVTYYEMHNRCL